MSIDLDLFAQAASLACAATAEPQTTPVAVEAVPEQVVALAGERLETIKALVRELAADVRLAARSMPLTAEVRGRVLFHLDHARVHGAPFSVAAAIRALREGA